MRHLIIALLLISLPAKSETIAYTTNQNGGKMVITTEICRDGKNRLAYSQSANVQTLLGCWVNDDSFIHIQWYDQELRSYPYDGWVVTKKQKPNT
jgi:hypothetical protein